MHDRVRLLVEVGHCYLLIGLMPADGSNRMNSEVHMALLSAQTPNPNAAKLIGQRFSVQMDRDPKYTVKATRDNGVFFSGYFSHLISTQ